MLDTKLARLMKWDGCCTGWHPSTNMAHAWMIVERLRADDWSMWVGPHSGSDKWEVEIAGVNFAVADTAPMAICLAAILVLEKR